MELRKLKEMFGVVEKTPTSEFENKLRTLISREGFDMITKHARTIAAGRGHFDTFDTHKIDTLIDAALRSPKVLLLQEDDRELFKAQLESYIRTGEITLTPEKTEESAVLHLDSSLRIDNNPEQAPDENVPLMQKTPEELKGEAEKISEQADEFIAKMNADQK